MRIVEKRTPSDSMGASGATIFQMLPKASAALDLDVSGKRLLLSTPGQPANAGWVRVYPLNVGISRPKWIE